MYRVFPSSCKIFASSRKIQFHRINTGDSERVVIPIVQVGTYPTRNFATFRPSELQPPSTIEYIQCKKHLNLTKSTGQASNPIHHIEFSRVLCFY